MKTFRHHQLRTPWVSWAALLGVVMGACGADSRVGEVESFAVTSNDSAPRELQAAHAMPADLRRSLVSAVQRDASVEYAAVVDVVGNARFDNPAQRMTAMLDRAGMVVRTNDQVSSLALRTSAYGCDGSTQQTPDVAPEVSSHRVSYRRSEQHLEEWYLNGPLGVEQGFVLDRAAGCAGTKVIELEALGDVFPALDDPDGDGRGQTVGFVGEDGRALFVYRDLSVIDATGKTLPAWMTVGAGQVALHFDDTGATYPVEVDPILSTQQTKWLPDGGGGYDRTGHSVAISSDGMRAIVGSDIPTYGSAFVFERENNAWVLKQKLQTTSGGVGEHLGYSVAIDGDTALVGTYAGDYANGVVYVYSRSAGVWPALPTSQLLAGDGSAGDYFGYSVAISGDTAIVGAILDDDKGFNSGSAYIFARQSGSTWAQEAKLSPSDGATYDQFGVSVAISGDTAVVGAYAADAPLFDSGAAYVYERSTWSSNYKQKLTASDGAANDYFGFSVAIAGNKILVGASGDDNPTFDSGSAYLFVHNGTWPANETTKFSASDGATGDTFGRAVAISGNIALVGARGRATAAGAVYAFDLPSANFPATLTEMAPKLFATNPAANNSFGNAVAIAGNYVLVGAPGVDTLLGTDSGAAYPFQWNGTTFVAETPIMTSHGADGDNFGFSVAVSDDEKTAIVGAPYDDDNGLDSGSAYIFERPSAASNWPMTFTKIRASDGSAKDNFGFSVAISNTAVLVGAAYDDDKGTDSGSAYVFDKSTGNWGQRAKLLATDGTAYDLFGYSVGISGDTVIVGAPYDDALAFWAGSVYLFTGNGGSWSQTRKYQSSDPATAMFDQYGVSVAISGDTAVVGAYADDAPLYDSGSASVFVRSLGSWPLSETVKLRVSDAVAGDHFGRAVAISDDTILIGAPNVGGLGAAYTFVRAAGNWPSLETTTLSASDGASGDLFGYTVAISHDTALVGAPWDDNRAGSAYVFVRPTGGPWPSNQTDKLVANDGVANNSFGVGLAVSGSTVLAGAHLSWAAGRESGAAYSFELGGLTQGTRCGSDIQCATGFCVDGVCCNSACTGICQACSVTLKKQGVDGTCGPILAGSAPKNAADCPASSPGSCGLDGACAGNGSCQFWPAGTSCGGGQTSCNGNKAVGESCNGSGSCTPSATGTECAPNLCQTQSGTCNSSCATDANCTEDAFCDPNGMKCKFKLPLGTACAVNSACESGHCVDGFCCNTPCDGICQACSTEKKGSGTNGYCGNARNGTDPKGDCAEAGQSSCLLDGECNGAGACRVYGPGTTCGANVCAGNVAKKQICSGLGTCTLELSGSDCQAYACDGSTGTCKTNCASDSDCIPNAYCNAGTCKFDEVLGAECTNDAQCRSGFCVDGVCCDSACTGKCRTCKATENESGKAGFCGNANNGTDPDDDCPDDGTNSCLRDGLCNGLGSCRLYAAGTSCDTKKDCADAQTIRAFECSGSGSCVQKLPSTDCYPYACSEGKCVLNGACEKEADCAPGAFCNGQAGSPGICVGNKALGETCSSDEQCGSRHCIDAVCCDSACSGACQACSATAKGSGVDGECGNVANGLDPHDDCTDDPAKPCGYTGQCNEFGACAVKAYGESCGDAVCTEGLKFNSQICNGVGTCVPNLSKLESCFPYVCDGTTACKTACQEYPAGSGQSDCVEGFDCRAGQCVPNTRTCTTIDDCNAGEVCDVVKNQCVPRPTNPPSEAPSCDCRFPGQSPSRPAWLWASLALCALAVARKRTQRTA